MLSERFQRIKSRMYRQSVGLIALAEHQVAALAALWAFLLSAILLHRAANAPHWSLPELTILLLLVLAPAAGISLAAYVFPKDTILALPQVPLARIGRWHRLDPLSAQNHASFGANGLMAGFAVGLLLNIAVRTGEFLAAVPATASVGPAWAQLLFATFAVDCIVFNMLYAAAFIMAVRHVPWFPRFMLLVWMMDIVSQLLIAHVLGTTALPGAVGSALGVLLTGNVQKTLLSMGLWLPYLLLSKRVNVTYRRRIRI